MQYAQLFTNLGVLDTPLLALYRILGDTKRHEIFLRCYYFFVFAAFGSC